MIPVKVTYQIGEGEVIEKHHEVAYGQEGFISIVAAATADAIRQENSPGTVNGTITLQFKETEKTYTKSYRIASSELFIDTLVNVESAISAFTDMFSNSAEKATLAEVSVAISETPIVKRASVQDVIVPDVILAGESATFKVMLLPHWSAAPMGERMLQREVTLDIPQNFIGAAQLSVVAEAGETDFFFSPFAFDDVPEETQPPKTLEDYIKQLEEVQIEQGRITITLSPVGFGDDFLFDDWGGPDDFGFDMPQPPEDFVLPEGDDIPFPEDVVPPEPIEKEIVIEGFIVTGRKEINVDIAFGDDFLEEVPQEPDGVDEGN